MISNGNDTELDAAAAGSEAARPLGAPADSPPMTLLRTFMRGGHYAHSDVLKNVAFKRAFVLKALGRDKTEPLRGTGPLPPSNV